MHIITRKRLHDSAKLHPNAKSKLAHWHRAVKSAVWNSLVDTKKTLGTSVDQCKVKSGRTVTIFNVSNDYRLITAIHYNRKKVYILLFLTHAEYDKNKWKDQL